MLPCRTALECGLNQLQVPLWDWPKVPSVTSLGSIALLALYLHGPTHFITPYRFSWGDFKTITFIQLKMNTLVLPSSKACLCQGHCFWEVSMQMAIRLWGRKANTTDIPKGASYKCWVFRFMLKLWMQKSFHAGQREFGKHFGERIHHGPLYCQLMFWADLGQVLNEWTLDGSDLRTMCSVYLMLQSP